MTRLASVHVSEVPWTDAETARLRELCAKGALSWAEIGLVFNRSKQSVESRARRLHIPKREVPKAAPLKAVRRIAGPPEMARIMRIAAPAPTSALHAAVTRIGCDMPLWLHNAAPTHEYCGAAVKIITHADGQVSRLSWCAAHARKVAA